MMHWDNMVAYQKVLRVMWIWLLIMGIAAALIGLVFAINETAQRDDVVQAESVERTKQCLDADGRMVKIDGYKGCFKLTLVPDSLIGTSFWNSNSESSQCAKILNAQMVKIDGFKNCFYFERMELEKENE